MSPRFNGGGHPPSTGQGLSRILRHPVLASMVKNPLPLIAEVESIFHTLETGVHGIQLSVEMAIGDHGLACIELILDIAASCRSRQAGQGVS